MAGTSNLPIDLTQAQAMMDIQLTGAVQPSVQPLPAYPEPWGVSARSRTLLRFPHTIFRDSKIAQVIRKIPILQMGEHRCNIRQLVIDFMIEAFTPEAIRITEQILRYADATVLQDVADLVAAVVIKCYMSAPSQQFDLAQILFEQSNRTDNHFLFWLSDVPVYAASEVYRVLTNRVMIHPRPANGLFARLSVEGAQYFNYNKLSIRNTITEVQVFIASLPSVTLEEIENGGSCVVCQEEFSRDGESAMVVNCGNSHVIGRNCLERWLGPESAGGQASRSCPMCRGVIHVG